MPKSEQKDVKLDIVFIALANNTRRKVIERLGAGSATVSELATRFDMALPSFVQHLGILERSGLVRRRLRPLINRKLLTKTHYISNQPIE